jgi:hypothetical protein
MMSPSSHHPLHAARLLAALLALAGAGPVLAVPLDPPPPQPAAATAQPAAATPQPAAAAAPPSAPTSADQGAGSTEQPEPTPPPTPPGVRRVIYLPETYKAELIEQLRREVMEQAKADGWAAPGRVPSWLSRLKLSGDVRGRVERSLYAGANANNGEFPDFNAINNNKPFDVNFVDVANERYLNVDQDRTRPRLRVRLALDASLGSGFSAKIRLATGDSSSPISTNQTVGTYFSKYPIWLDRAWIAWKLVTQDSGLAVQVGRMENPFLSTDLVWNNNLNFDGLTARGIWGFWWLRNALIVGAFPLYTTPVAWPAERPQKFPSHDKWLYAAQLTSTLPIDQDITLSAGVAYYDFQGIEGRLSGPCDTHLKDVSCDSDDSRPVFAQRGNTYMALRTPSAAALAAEAAGLVPRYQYFGLASRFGVLAATGRLEATLTPALKATVDGEFAKNLALTGGQVQGRALNNLGPCTTAGDCGRWAGSATGYTVRLALGSPAQDKQGSWSAGLGYRLIGSDAVVDGFNDADFGLGGTNLKGYTAGASYAVGDGTTLGVRWFSADSVAGPTFQVDLVQVDLVSRF